MVADDCNSRVSAAILAVSDLSAAPSCGADRPRGQAIEPVLPAAEVAKLVDGLVGDLGSRLPGLVICDGEMRLEVAFGRVGGDNGFVVPSATSSRRSATTCTRSRCARPAGADAQTRLSGQSAVDGFGHHGHLRGRRIALHHQRRRVDVDLHAKLAASQCDGVAELGERLAAAGAEAVDVRAAAAQQLGKSEVLVVAPV